MKNLEIDKTVVDEEYAKNLTEKPAVESLLYKIQTLEIEVYNKIEKRYGEYVYQCACIELTPLSFGEFNYFLSEGKCETCIINGECTCKNS